MQSINLKGWARAAFGSGLALIFLLACGEEQPAAAPPRSAQLLSEGWRFLAGEADASGIGFDDGSPGWTSVRLPHTYNALDGQDGGDDYYRGASWYRLPLPLGEKREERRYWLQLDAANISAEVYVNGTHVGGHTGGFSPSAST